MFCMDNIMKPKLILIVAAILISSMSYGKARLIPLTEKISESDFIARIKIISTVELERKKGKPSIEEAMANEGYRFIAKAKVIYGIKGSSEDQIIDLEFDNGFTCPNVRYYPNDDCVIFAVKMENGHYCTYNTYYGKIHINQLTMSSGEQLPFVNGVALSLGHETYIPLEEAIRKIKQVQNQSIDIYGENAR